MKEQVRCSFCGAVLTEEAVHEFEGQVMCEDCFYEHTTECECCHERIWQDSAEIDNDITLCSFCYENYYTNCEMCGRIIHRDNARYEDDCDDPYCENCFNKLEEKSINSYGYKPQPIFFGCGKLFYGVELEIDKGGSYDSNAETLLNIANSESKRMYCKYDGSISNGFEMVSHPMSLDYHINHMDWLDIFNHAIDMGYRSHNTTTCGLHIHASRSAFGKTRDEQEDVISRIVYFVEAHWNELLKFSRRTEMNMMRWASRYGIAENTKLTYDKAKKKSSMGRYVAVNLANYNTIEFRIFRGTLRYKTFIAALQLVDEICRLAITFDDKTVENLSWSDFVSNISKNSKPELIEYLRSKRLYVNDEVAEMEEV